MKRFLRTTIVAALAVASSAVAVWAYDYPVENRYAATVIGTPSEFAYPLPEKFPFKTYTLKHDGVVPDVLWYERGLKFGAALHDGERRPLIFFIAGTGASYRSAKSRSMAKALHSAGYHVITLTSPTHMNFLVNASTTHLPGYPQDDTEDLYRVMEQAYAKVRDAIEVSEFHVTGYSLGGMHAAFVSLIDEERGSFKFSKVLMINPPVDLFNSVNILDDMLVEAVPGGVDGVPAFLDRTIDYLAEMYSDDQELRFDGNFLYDTYERILAEREAAGLPTDGKGARGLIGISFRLSSAGMVFGADVMNNSGYIVGRGIELGKYDSLTRYSRISHRVTFQEYVDDLLVPGLLARKPGATREKLLADASLHAIEDYLKSATKISAVTNEDEIILAPNELGYLKTLLGDRLKTYPLGGHCGNMDYRDNVQDMIDYFGN